MVLAKMKNRYFAIENDSHILFYRIFYTARVFIYFRICYLSVRIQLLIIMR